MKMDRRAGFAVVLVVALLAAIVLLLVALAGLGRGELRAAGQRTAAELARRNALVGLRLALGRLQATAGPDARSTATAQRFGVRNPHWTGVWADVGAPVWLVSGAPTSSDVAVVTSGPGANGALLVGANSTSAPDGAVAALFESIVAPEVPGLSGEQTVGRFAYWIGDEGVRGNVGVVDRIDAVPLPVWPAADDPVTSATERARLRQLVAHRSGNDAVDGFQLLTENDAVSAVRWGQFGAALTVPQFRFQDLGTAQATENYRAFLRRRHHDFSIHSAGVLANAASGGLRLNFSDLASAQTPAAVNDLERYRPSTGRLSASAGSERGEGATAQIKPIVTEWALDFVPYREDGGSRLLVGCRLRVELWNPFNLPLAASPAGVPDFRVRVGGRRANGLGVGSGLPSARVSGPAGAAGTMDLAALLGPVRDVVLDLPGDIPAGGVVTATVVVENAWDSGLLIDDPTPTDTSDDVLRCETVADAAREFSLTIASAGDGETLTALESFPSAEFARGSRGGWTVAGNTPFASGGDAVERLGVSYHFRLNPGRATWADWVAPTGLMRPAPDLKAAQIDHDAGIWKSVSVDPAESARSVQAQFAAGELFFEGTTLTAYDFTVQRNLSIAALAQLSVAGERPLGIGSPWGGARNAVFDEAFFNPVPGDWRTGDLLPNVRHRVVSGKASSGPDAAGLADSAAARFLLVDGMFNVNSVSVEAWTDVLGRAVLGWTDATGASHDLENPFFIFGQSAPFAPANARGVRQFSDEAIQALASELSARIAARPRPFRSLEEFVNSGVLQEAIDAAGLNTRAKFCADLGGVTPARFSANYLTQAAVLNTLAPVLAVRSDTFTIRVAAEALNPALPAEDPERVASRAWCEAVVQRLPEFVDASEDAAEWPAVLPENQALGRRFRIVQFRWLGPDDI
jgi:hypothetical protein